MASTISTWRPGLLYLVFLLCQALTSIPASGQFGEVIYEKTFSPTIPPTQHFTKDISSHRLDIIKDISKSFYDDTTSDARNKQGFKIKTSFILEGDSDKTLFQLYSTKYAVGEGNLQPSQNVLEFRCKDRTFIIRTKVKDVTSDAWMEWVLWDTAFIQSAANAEITVSFIMDNQHIKVINETEDKAELYYYGLSASSLEYYINENNHLYAIVGGKSKPSAAITHSSMSYDIGDQAHADQPGSGSSGTARLGSTSFPNHEFSEGRTEYSSFTVYPNPAVADEIFVRYNHDGAVTVNIYDLQGRIHYTKVESARAGDNVIHLSSLGHLNPGIYIVELSGAHFRGRRKIIYQGNGSYLR